MSSKKVSDYMTALPHTIRDNLTVKEAQDLMQEYNCRHLPVLHGGKIVGILSDRDTKIAMSFDGGAELPAMEAMSQDPYTITPETSLKDVAQTMHDKKYGCAIVADVDDHAKGIFTITNALEALIDAL